jgi:opacity protein-like surface antigen
MKKILFAALIAVSIVSGAFAQDNKKVSYRVLNAFTSEFNEASDVSWTSKPDFDRASFNLDGKQLSAFYTYSGEKIGVTEDVSFEALPSKAKKSMSKKYNGYSITETILFEGDRETAYFVAAENDARSVIFKVMDGQVTVFKKKAKTSNSNSSAKSLQLAIF